MYNLSHDESIAEKVCKVFGDKRVTSGPEVMLFWQMITNLKQVKGELEKSHYQLQSIIRNVMDGIIMINELEKYRDSIRQPRKFSAIRSKMHWAKT